MQGCHGAKVEPYRTQVKLSCRTRRRRKAKKRSRSGKGTETTPSPWKTMHDVGCGGRSSRHRQALQEFKKNNNNGNRKITRHLGRQKVSGKVAISDPQTSHQLRLSEGSQDKKKPLRQTQHLDVSCKAEEEANGRAQKFRRRACRVQR